MCLRRPSPPSHLGLATYVFIGLGFGLVYAFLDALFDARIEAGTLVGSTEHVHALLHHVLPIVTGGLIGLVGHSLGRRARIIIEERRRSDGLHRRLEKVQREQAVWVMVASVLHEIHNPLHSLGLLLDELGEDPGAATNLVPRARVQIERVVTQLRTLRALPAMAQPAQGPVDLDALVAALARDISPLARARGVNVHVSASPGEGVGIIAQGDAAYVRIILENLVHNGLDALEHVAPQARELEVILSEDVHAVYVRVCDRGPGIGAELRARVFEPLGTTKQSGLGLGLPIARALARSMGGDLVLDPGPGGASFLLSLPRAESLAA